MITSEEYEKKLNEMQVGVNCTVAEYADMLLELNAIILREAIDEQIVNDIVREYENSNTN